MRTKYPVKYSIDLTHHMADDDHRRDTRCPPTLRGTFTARGSLEVESLIDFLVAQKKRMEAFEQEQEGGQAA